MLRWIAGFWQWSRRLVAVCVFPELMKLEQAYARRGSMLASMAKRYTMESAGARALVQDTMPDIKLGGGQNGQQ